MITEAYMSIEKTEQTARISALRDVADNFFQKSLACTKMADVKAFFDLAQQANESADELQSSLKIESCWTYLHFVEFFGYSEEYTEYLEFCARNRLDAICKDDFQQALSYKRTESHSAEVMMQTAHQ